jgi:hypothetical protein
VITNLITAAADAGGGVDINNVISVISALAAAAAIAMTSLRKRKDVSITELDTRVKRLSEEVIDLETDRDAARETANMNGRQLFTVRQVLAAHGITDPTSPEKSDPE